MKTYITTWLYGAGIVLNTFTGSDGKPQYLANFPGYGRQFVKSYHLSGKMVGFSIN